MLNPKGGGGGGGGKKLYEFHLRRHQVKPERSKLSTRREGGRKACGKNGLFYAKGSKKRKTGGRSKLKQKREQKAVLKSRTAKRKGN